MLQQQRLRGNLQSCLAGAAGKKSSGCTLSARAHREGLAQQTTYLVLKLFDTQTHRATLKAKAVARMYMHTYEYKHVDMAECMHYLLCLLPCSPCIPVRLLHEGIHMHVRMGACHDDGCMQELSYQEELIAPGCQELI